MALEDLKADMLDCSNPKSQASFHSFEWGATWKTLQQAA